MGGERERGVDFRNKNERQEGEGKDVERRKRYGRKVDLGSKNGIEVDLVREREKGWKRQILGEEREKMGGRVGGKGRKKCFLPWQEENPEVFESREEKPQERRKVCFLGDIESLRRCWENKRKLAEEDKKHTRESKGK